jgi:hypothetical protein
MNKIAKLSHGMYHCQCPVCKVVALVAPETFKNRKLEFQCSMCKTVTTFETEKEN